MPRANRSPNQRGADQPRTGKTGQRRASQALLAGLRDAAIEQAALIHSGADWLRLLRYAEHFHTYGGTNALLILRERPYATRLATYDQWKTNGHPVQRGEHGITLLDPADSERTLRLFDITQTGQAPALGPLRQLRPARHTAKALRQALTSIAMRKRFDIVTNAPDGPSNVPARTAFTEHTIHLHPDLTKDAACYALAHELAHVLLHNHDQLDSLTGACDGLRLAEAESVAYILCRNAGLDVAPFTFPDPPIWAGTDPRADPGATILTAIERITTTARRLITQIDTIDPEPIQPTQPAERDIQPATKTTRPAPTKITSPAPAPKPQHDPRLVDIHHCAEQYFTSRLPGSWVPGYLATRGLATALDDDASWDIGYAPTTWTALTDHLRANGYTDEEIITSGLGKRSRSGSIIDRFRDRAMFPVRAPDGTTIAFIGRANPDTPPSGAHPVPKYLNSPQTPLYTKGTVIYGLDAAQDRLRRGAIPVLVEGTLDAIAIHIADRDQRYAPIAPSGTALTTEQITALAQAVDLHERGILVAFDGDPAGQHAAARAHQLLHPHAHRLLHARLDAGDDPAGLLENHGPQHLLAALSNRRPLALAVLDERLSATHDQPEWQRRDQAAQLIAKLTPPEKVQQLAAANIPSPDRAPEDAVSLPATKAADLLPYVTKALILRAADDIGIPITSQINAVVDAASEQARKTRTESGYGGGPPNVAARDSPDAAAKATAGTGTSATPQPILEPPQRATRSR